LLTTGWIHAAPYSGEEAFTYRQPDGETFQIRLYGKQSSKFQAVGLHSIDNAKNPS